MTPPEQPSDRLIAALDFPDTDRALENVRRLEGLIHWFKVGLGLYLSAGNTIVDQLKRQGFSVFLDLKLYDIPNTVASAVKSISQTHPDMLTVHASGGPAMLEAAVGAAASLEGAPRLLAVTVLTSMDKLQLAAIGLKEEPAVQAMRLARMASDCGIFGLVCSPEEAAAMRGELPGSCLVTPGIRSIGDEQGDQKRIAAPAAAIRAGADYLVVGRPIFSAADPAAAAQSILDEIARAQA